MARRGGARGRMNLAGMVMPVLMVALGVLLVVRAVTAGGGPLALGVVIGVLFVAAGTGRLYLERRAR